MIDLPLYRQLIDGRTMSGGAAAEVVNPATGRVTARYAVAGPQDVDRAVAAAGRAWADWRGTSLAERRALLRTLADVVDAESEALARLLTCEQGKPLREARSEVGSTVEIFRHYADLHAERPEALFDERGPGWTRRYSPLGVVAGIIPWNFPLLIMAMKVAPALLTGNAIIVKPAPTTPLTTLEVARLCADRIPPGLVQVLGDDGTVGPRLSSHPAVRKIAFTGSTQTGRRVMAAASPTLKRLTLELGGNDPAIVLDDADVPRAAGLMIEAAFGNCGQICGAIKRIYAHDRVYDDLCAELARRIDRMTVGDGLDGDVDLGPVQNRMQYDKARAGLADGARHGEILAQADVPAGDGYFIAPTLLAGLDDDHALVAEEQFAPLLPILRFGDEADAVRRANATPFGLTASVWSSDRARAGEVASQLDAGLICINRHNDGPLTAGLSMAKASGCGWMFGDEGLKEYLQAHLMIDA